jgi:hypothetical protein
MMGLRGLVNTLGRGGTPAPGCARTKEKRSRKAHGVASRAVIVSEM